MIVEIMGKVQNGTSLANVRLDAAKNDLETLRRDLVSRTNELAAKDGEIADLKAKLNEAELSKVAVEKALAEVRFPSISNSQSHEPLSKCRTFFSREYQIYFLTQFQNIQKSSEMIQTSPHSTPSRKPLSGFSSSGGSPDVEESSSGSSETRIGDQSGTRVAAEKIGDKSAAQMDQSDAQLGGEFGQPGDKSLVQIGDGSDGQLGVHSGKMTTQSGAQVGAQSDAQLKEQSGQLMAQSGGQIGAHSGAQEFRPQTEDSSRESFSSEFSLSATKKPRKNDIHFFIHPSAASAASRIGQRLSEILEKDGEDKITSGSAQQSSRFVRQQKSDRPSRTDVGVQSGKRDTKRSSDVSLASFQFFNNPFIICKWRASPNDFSFECNFSFWSQLESEVVRLRKENERILREKADYESAIQRALLRGVSSLNAETLKVLKCPPVSCYSPCRPPPSPVNAA